MGASASRDPSGVGTSRRARAGSVRDRAHLRLEAAASYRTAASVWRVPGWPNFPPGSRATSGSTAIIGVRGRLHCREAAAGAPEDVVEASREHLILTRVRIPVRAAAARTG